MRESAAEEIALSVVRRTACVSLACDGTLEASETDNEINYNE